jgi:hypothetical protein
MRKSGFYKLSVIVLLLFFVSCSSKKDKLDQPVSSADVQYPVITITDNYSMGNELPLYELSKDFVKNLILGGDNYDGTQVTMHVSLPDEWGLIGIERMSQGRELWLVQSKNREWTYLVITSGSGTQRILDAVPIGLDLAKEDSNTLEREEWSWHRDEDGAFIVDKYYEWKKSIAGATTFETDDYVRTVFAQDKYVINDMGRFDCYPQDIADTLQYKVVVLYRGQQTFAEDWDEKTEYIEAFCEDQKLYYCCVRDNFNHVSVSDYLSNDILTLDITPEITSDSVGMILYQNGKPPKHVNFRGVEYLQMEIQKYFKN